MSKPDAAAETAERSLFRANINSDYNDFVARVALEVVDSRWWKHQLRVKSAGSMMQFCDYEVRNRPHTGGTSGCRIRCPSYCRHVTALVQVFLGLSSHLREHIPSSELRVILRHQAAYHATPWDPVKLGQIEAEGRVDHDVATFGRSTYTAP